MSAHQTTDLRDPDFRLQRMVDYIRELGETANQAHGTTDGKRDCPYPNGALAFLLEHRHACSKCLAIERLQLIEEACGAELWCFRVRGVTGTNMPWFRRLLMRWRLL